MKAVVVVGSKLRQARRDKCRTKAGGGRVFGDWVARFFWCQAWHQSRGQESFSSFGRQDCNAGANGRTAFGAWVGQPLEGETFA